MIGRRSDGRLNHKPIPNYVPGVDLPTDEEAELLRQPNDATEEAKCSEVIRRIAAEIKARNLEMMKDRR